MDENKVESSDETPQINPEKNTLWNIWLPNKIRVTLLGILSLLLTFLYKTQTDIFVLIVQGTSIFLLTYSVFWVIQLIAQFYGSKERSKLISNTNSALKPLLKNNANLLFLAVVFYLGLIFVVATTGWIIRNEWAILVIALAPLIIYLLLQIAPNMKYWRITEFTAGVQGISLKIAESQMTRSLESSKIRLKDGQVTEKARVSEIDIIEGCA